MSPNAYRIEAGGADLLLGHVHEQLPKMLEIDRLRVVLLDGERELGRAEVPLTRYEQKNRFRLPVRGCWFVSSGHDFGVEHRRWYNRSHPSPCWSRPRCWHPRASGGCNTTWRSPI
jgi:hypothetical protein